VFSKVEIPEIPIEVRLFYELDELSLLKGEEGKHIIFLPKGSKVSNLLLKIGIDLNIKITAIINGKKAELNNSLSEGDIICLFPDS